MPNWLSNTLKVIKGDPKEIFGFVRTEKSVFDFNKIVPMPDSIENSKEEVVSPSGFKEPAQYSWAIDNWGTKWNASEASYCTTDPEHAIWFDTAWDPPVPIFEALAKRFPEHEIVVYSDDDMNQLQVTFTLKEGMLTCDACQCFGESEISVAETPLTKAELDYFGIEEAP